jgi:putative ABC transport system ATP-binding protein
MDYFMKHTGIPLNFGIAVALGFIVGTAIAGQTFDNFTLDNLRYFGALKAMGASNSTLLGMILLQALVVGIIGYGLGVGAASLFGYLLGSTDKTTLIAVIAAILDQDEHECLVFGQNLNRMGQRDKTHYRGQHIGFVFQAFNLLPTLTAAENVAVPLLINGVGCREAVARAQETLSRVGLGERMHALPAQLSGGQQQRVAIARALVHEPQLIVCDEPTGALDHEAGRRVMELLRTVALDAGRALIIVTHDARIFEFADRMARMDDDRITTIVDSPREVSSTS